MGQRNRARSYIFECFSENCMMLRNFKRRELSCRCCGELKIDSVLATKLQALRDIVDFPIVLNSAYRCKKHNATVLGAAKASSHCTGKAVDIKTVGWSGVKLHKLLNSAFKLGFGGVGIYKSHIHLDVGRERLWVG